MGAGQDLTVLNSFFLKSFLGLQFSVFFPPFDFLLIKKKKSYETEQVDCGLQEWWRLTLLVLFPLGPPSGLGVGAGCGGGQEAPCKHLDSGWVRGWCWAKPGVPGWRSGCPSKHRPWETQHGLPSPITEQNNG